MIPEQVMANIRIARDALQNHADHGACTLEVDMGTWLADSLDEDDREEIELYEFSDKLDCGTCGCAIGHIAVLLGNSFEHTQFQPFTGENFRQYITRLFGTREDGIWHNILERDVLVNWLFHYEWAECDNTLEGILARFDYVLITANIPKWFSEKMDKSTDEFKAKYNETIGV